MPTPRWTLMAILVLAALLRLPGLDWGLPGDLHRFSYHPDEWQAVETALRMAQECDTNPHFFNYPTLHPALLAVLDTGLGLAGTQPPLAVVYLLARCVTVLFALGTIALLALLGRDLGSPRAGLLAAGFLAVLPLHVVNAHYATIDVPLAFWGTLTLWFAVRVARADDTGPVPGPLLLSGAVAAGCAAGTKYNGVLVWVPLLLAAPWRFGRRGVPYAAAAALLAAVTFCATSPYVFIDPAAWPQIRFELFEHPRASNLYQGVGPGWWFHLRWNLPTVAGSLFGLAAAVGLVDLARTRRREVWLLLVYGALVAASLLGTKELFCRYWLPLLPPLCLAAAWSLRRWSERPRRALAVAAVIAVVPALRSAAYTAMLARPDARDLAAQWCAQNLAPGESIGVDGPLWFWSVPLHLNNGGARTRSARYLGRWRLRTDPEQWLDGGPNWLAFNRAHLERTAPDRRALAGLSRHYRPVFAARNEARILPGWRETGLGCPMHDWTYPLPAAEIWQALEWRDPQALPEETN